MIDLHCHSIFSDGDQTPNELLQKAEDLKLTFFSITDHDNCFAYENMDKSIFSGKLLSGVEIVTSFEKHIIELLAYGIDTKQINEWSRTNKKKEKDFAKTIFKKLTNIFDDNNIIYTKNPNMEELIDNDDPTGILKQYLYNDLLKFEINIEIIGEEILSSYSNFNKKGLNNPNSLIFINECTRFPSLDDAVKLIHKNGGLCFLAHVYQYNVENHIEFLNKILGTVKLDGVETYHSSFSKEQTLQINQYADKNCLYKCGGSDFHGKLKPNSKLGMNGQISEEIISTWINKIKY